MGDQLWISRSSRDFGLNVGFSISFSRRRIRKRVSRVIAETLFWTSGMGRSSRILNIPGMAAFSEKRKASWTDR